jgi:protein involved in polysaccharide export with SLBB domain
MLHAMSSLRSRLMSSFSWRPFLGVAALQWRAAAPCVALLFAASMVASGCSSARNSSSPFVAAPHDPAREAIRGQVRGLMSNAEKMLGEAYQEYYLGPGDIITITLVGRPDILGVTGSQDSGVKSREGLTVTISDNPLLTLPLVGAVRVHGKTVEKLQEELGQAFSNYAKDPKVVITVDKYYRRQVTVLGAVTKPDRYPLDFGDTVLDALFKAGGLTFVSKGGLPPGRYLKVYREKVTQKQRVELPPQALLNKFRERGGLILPREEIVIPIEEFILGGDLAYNIPLIPNDIVFIPGAGTVNIQGKVRAPGVVIMGPSLRTLTQAITERGGLMFAANKTVEVVRANPSGAPDSYFLNARAMLKRQEPDFLLQDGDQIFVYTHSGRQVLAWFGDLFQATVSTGVNATYGVGTGA